MEIKIVKLNKDNLGLAYSCTKETNLWGSHSHQKSIDFLLKNLDYKIYAYGITLDGALAGHVILFDTKQPLSMVESKDGVFLNCIYILESLRNQKFGTMVLKHIENQIKEEGKKIIFTHSIGENEWMSKNFFIKNGFVEAPTEDDLLKILYKSFDKEVSFRIISDDKNRVQTKTNQILIIYNPLCPLENEKFDHLKEIVKKEFEEVEIEEIHSLDKTLSSGIFFNNIPLLYNKKKDKEILDIIRSLMVKI
uniref:GNAT family N-acetyltransferase n=1 Tax=candidate division WOR-3 bacterium TaxID=2052148 RepID=A0A7C3J6X5_UNCW3